MKKIPINNTILGEALIFLILLISFVYVLPRWADPNQNSRLDMVVAVVDDGTFQIDKYVSNTVDYAKVGEHYYSDKAPGTAFIGIPIYAGIKIILDLPVMDKIVDRLSQNAAFRSTLNPEGSGIFVQKVRFAITQVILGILVSAIPTALTGVLLFRLLKLFDPEVWSRLFVVLTYGLLTPVFTYGGAFYGHQLSAALLFGVFYLIMTRDQFPMGTLLLIGFLLGYSVITEYPSALIAGILFIYLGIKLFTSRKKFSLAWVVLSGSVVAGGWMIYNTYIFGGPFSLGYSNSELWVAQHHTGFMSLSIPTWDAFWGITFGKFRGLFFYSPILILGLVGGFLWLRSKRYRIEWYVAFASVISFFIFNSSSIMWWGGFAVGPRYLLPMLPFWMLFLIHPIILWRKETWFKLLLVALTLWSWILTWGLSLAGQAYPSDALRDPVVEYALPSWQSGNIARNLGTFLGLPGPLSIVPLLLLLCLALTGFAWNKRSMFLKSDNLRESIS